MKSERVTELVEETNGFEDLDLSKCEKPDYGDPDDAVAFLNIMKSWRVEAKDMAYFKKLFLKGSKENVS